LVGLWTEGIAYIVNNTKEFNDKEGHIVQGEYSISIDLSNLEGNIGKELYNDGTHRIYVSHLENTGRTYIIVFRSIGDYSLTSASLVSGVHHATINENSFTILMSAKMTANYNGEIYESSESGISGLNYKNGDDFSFYIFPSDAYKTINEKDIVKLTVTDLYKNIWRKK